jgi:hypothetical protein
MTTTVPHSAANGRPITLPASPQGRTGPHNAPVLDAAGQIRPRRGSRPAYGASAGRSSPRRSGRTARSHTTDLPRGQTAAPDPARPGGHARPGATREWVASLAPARSRTGTSRAAHPTHPASDQQRKRSGLNARRTPRALRPASPSSHAFGVPANATLPGSFAPQPPIPTLNCATMPDPELRSTQGFTAPRQPRCRPHPHTSDGGQRCQAPTTPPQPDSRAAHSPSRGLTAMAAVATPTHRPQPSPMTNPETGCVIDARIPEKVSDTGQSAKRCAWPSTGMGIAGSPASCSGRPGTVRGWLQAARRRAKELRACASRALVALDVQAGCGHAGRQRAGRRGRGDDAGGLSGPAAVRSCRPGDQAGRVGARGVADRRAAARSLTAALVAARAPRGRHPLRASGSHRSPDPRRC